MKQISLTVPELLHAYRRTERTAVLIGAPKRCKWKERKKGNYTETDKSRMEENINENKLLDEGINS